MSIFLYPIVSNYIASKTQSVAISDYNDMMNELTDEEKANLLEAAQAHNQEMAGQGTAETSDKLKDTTSYADFLKTGNVIGYIKIDKINVNLPIYQGSTDEILERGVGHLETSSMPVGGASTHCILTGHRGLPTSKLFTDLDKIEIGDTFKITAFEQTLTYKVDQIIVVEPEDVSELQIAEGKDYCTLITCTPYMINTHRLLVRGIRIENLDEETGVFDTETNKYYPDKNIYDGVFPILLWIIIIISALTFFITLNDTKDRIFRKKTKKKPIEKISKLDMYPMPIIPVETRERVKIYDLPMLELSEQCHDIEIYDPKTIYILTDEALERIKNETTIIDNIKAKELETKQLENKQEKPEVEKHVININNKNIIKKEKKANKKKNIDKKNIKIAVTAAIVSAITTLGLTYIITKKKNKRD